MPIWVTHLAIKVIIIYGLHAVYMHRTLRLCDVMVTAIEYVGFCCVVTGVLNVAVEATVLVITYDVARKKVS